MYKIAHNVLLVLKYQKKWRKNLAFAFEKIFWSISILTSFDLTQNFDFILTYKIYLNRLQSTRNQCWYKFDDITKPWKIFDLTDFCRAWL